MIFKYKSTKLNSSKFTNNLIKHWTFVYIKIKDQKVLFQTIQFSKSKLNGSKYCYVSQTSIIYSHTVGCSKSIIFNNPLYHKLNGSKYCYVSLTIQLKIKSFVYTMFNYQTVLFQTIQFSISPLFTLN